MKEHQKTLLILIVPGVLVAMATWFYLYVAPKDAVLDAASECAQGQRARWESCLTEAERLHDTATRKAVGY